MVRHEDMMIIVMFAEQREHCSWATRKTLHYPQEWGKRKQWEPCQAATTTAAARSGVATQHSLIQNPSIKIHAVGTFCLK